MSTGRLFEDLRVELRSMTQENEHELGSAPGLCAVCDRNLEGQKTVHSQEFRGLLYSFCSADCLREFLEDPEAFMEEEDES